MPKKPLVDSSREVLFHIDTEKKVRVYRNLHKGCLSVKQDGIVQCHTHSIVLKDCTFIVSNAGRERVRKERRKNVHSYVEGYVVNARDTDHLLPFSWQSLYYNPYTTDFWTDMENDRAVQEAQWVDIDATSPKDISVLALNIGYKKESACV